MKRNKDNLRELSERVERLLTSEQARNNPDDLINLIQELHARQTELYLENESLHKTHQSLHKSSRLYSCLFNLTPLSILRLDHRLMVLEANGSAVKQFGSEKLLLGKPFLSLVDGTHQLRCRAHFHNAAKLNNWSHCEVDLIIDSGERKNLEIYTAVLLAEHGDLEGYLVALVDNSQLHKDRAEMEETAQKLREVNTTLKVLLQEREVEIGKVKEAIAVNIIRFIQPLLDSLEKSGLRKDQKSVMKALHDNLDKITSGFALKITSAAYGLSHRELEVAHLIRDGLTSDEISEMLNISSSCVLFHRNKIRRKLGLIGKKKRLAEHLAQLDQDQ